MIGPPSDGNSPQTHHRQQLQTHHPATIRGSSSPQSDSGSRQTSRPSSRCNRSAGTRGHRGLRKGPCTTETCSPCLVPPPVCVCVCVCACVCVCVCVCVCACLRVRVRACLRLRACLRVGVCVSAYAYSMHSLENHGRTPHHGVFFL